MSLTSETASFPESPSQSSDLESRPLLHDTPMPATGGGVNRTLILKPHGRTPLPLAALLILAFVRIAEPINFTQLFPYVNQMIEDLGIATPENVGYYSGMVDSCFSFAQLLTIYFWSTLSDRIGRKPVIMMGVSGAALSAFCFGFSTSLPGMLISRSMAGALSGNVAVVNSMVSEMTDDSNQGAAFPLLGATWYVGCIIGPMIGGGLSNPSIKWPELVKRFPIFQTYVSVLVIIPTGWEKLATGASKKFLQPYLLPCLVSSSFSVFAVMVCGVFVQETLPSKVAARKAAAERNSGSLDPASSASPSILNYGSGGTSTSAAPTSSPDTALHQASFPQPSTFVRSPPEAEPTPRKRILLHLLSKPEIRAILTAAFLFNLVGIGFDVVFTLYSYTSVELGGMSRTPTQIGWVLAISGIVGTVSALSIFPHIQRRFNNRHLYTFFSVFWPITYALMPMGNLVARRVKRADTKGGVAAEGWLWAAIAMILTPEKIAVNLYPLTMIIIKSSIDDPGHLGSMFGLQQTTSAVARGIAPYFVSTLFAFSVDRRVLGGNLIWIVMVVLSLLGVAMTLKVADVPAPQILLATDQGHDEDEAGP
ncbi:MFS general substrate transporter [Clavulina sp. PMI_390]|nr:MFS general substrate transporter [Clavulina sp. PMI_390]